MFSKTKELGLFRIIVIGLIVLFRLSYYLNAEFGQIYWDTGAFVDYQITAGLKTPGYPLLIDIFQLLLGERYAIGVIFVQIIVSCISVYYVYKCFCYVTKNERLSLFGTLLYGCSSGIYCWDMILLSESLSISLTVFFLYYALSWIQSFQKKDAILLFLTCFLSFLIKNALFVYGIACLILIGFIFLFKKEERKHLPFPSMLFGILMLFFLGYATFTYVTTGVFHVSCLQARHDLAISLQSNLYKNYPDKELVAKIEKIYVGNNYSIEYDTTDEVLALFGDTFIEQNKNALAFNKVCLSSDRITYLKNRIYTAYGVMNNTFNEGYGHYVDRSLVLKGICFLGSILFNFLKIGHIYVCLLLGAIVFCKEWMQRKQIPLDMLGLVGGILTIVVSVFVGTYGEFSRTLIYVLPFVYLLGAKVIKSILNI